MKRSRMVICIFLSGMVFLTACAPPPGGENHAPVAVITFTDALPVLPDLIGCDATASTDADGDDLSCLWQVTALLPDSGSAVVLGDPTADVISLNPGVSGLFKVDLTVSDGSASAAVTRYVYLRPAGITPGPEVSQLKFTLNGDSYDISFTLSDWIWYEILQKAGNTARCIDLALWTQTWSNLKYFVYYEPGSEADPIPAGAIQLYDEVACANLPREWSLGSITAAGFALIVNADTQCIYRDSDAHVCFLGNHEDGPWEIVTIVE